MSRARPIPRTLWRKILVSRYWNQLPLIVFSRGGIKSAAASAEQRIKKKKEKKKLLSKKSFLRDHSCTRTAEYISRYGFMHLNCSGPACNSSSSAKPASKLVTSPARKKTPIQTRRAACVYQVSRRYLTTILPCVCFALQREPLRCSAPAW